MSDFKCFERRVRGEWQEIDIFLIEKGDILRINGDTSRLFVCTEPRQMVNEHRSLGVIPYHGT